MGFKDTPWKIFTNLTRAIQTPGIWICHDVIDMFQTFYDHFPN